MKKLLLFATLFLMGAGCSYGSVAPEKTADHHDGDVSASFKMDFKYGVGARNELNTFQGTYTKDMIADEPITIDLELTDEELQDIEDKIDELDVFASVKEETNMIVVPCVSYDLLTEMNGVQERLTWDCGEFGSNQKLDALREYINVILESKDAIRALPVPQGGYL